MTSTQIPSIHEAVRHDSASRLDWRRGLLACGVAAPVLAIGTTLLATAVNPDVDPARRYLSELGGAAARTPWIFNVGVFVSGVMAGLAGVGFGMAVADLGRARIIGVLVGATFVLSGIGLTQAALYPWPDPRHLAINLALGIQLAPVMMHLGLWRRRGLPGLKGFLSAAFGLMAILTALTKHLILPSVVNDGNVGWWERAFAIVLVGWVGVASVLLDRCLRRAGTASKAA